MKVKVFAYLELDEDIIELDDNLTEKELEEEVYDYVSEFFDWGYEKIEEEEE